MLVVLPDEPRYVDRAFERYDASQVRRIKLAEAQLLGAIKPRPGRKRGRPALLKSYTKTIAKTTGLRITQVERAPVNPPTMARVGIYLSAEQYDALSKKYAKSSAIVAFVALPSLTDSSIRAAQSSGAQWLIVSDYGPEYKRLLAREAMRLAIVPRLQDPPEFPKPRTLQEQFEREYEVITPNRASELPE